MFPNRKTTSWILDFYVVLCENLIQSNSRIYLLPVLLYSRDFPLSKIGKLYENSFVCHSKSTCGRQPNFHGFGGKCDSRYFHIGKESRLLLGINEFCLFLVQSSLGYPRAKKIFSIFFEFLFYFCWAEGVVPTYSIPPLEGE